MAERRLSDVTQRDQYHRMGDDLVSLHIAHLQAGGRSNRTIESRASVLGRLNNWLPFGLAYAATEQLEAWLSHLRIAGRSRWTLCVYHYHMTMFYRWATKTGHLDGDPSATIDAPRHPRSIPNPVTEDELAAALQVEEPIRTAVILAGFAGLRSSEAAGCWREHITEEQVLVVVGKGGDPGIVPTHPLVWEHVRDRPPGPLITDRWGAPVHGHWLTVHTRKVMDRHGLPDVHLHRLRHRYGSVIQALTGDIRVTQECLRHASIQSTQGYTKVSQGQRARAVRDLPVPRGGDRPDDPA